METIEALEETAREAADRAGRLVRERFADARAGYRLKDDALDLVTETDRASEATILEVIRSRFPHHAIVAEESGAHGSGEARWLVDPLDGTTNFAHRYPQISISIAFQRAGRTELGVVHDPIRGETFVGRRGGGATLDGAPLRVSTVADLGQALLATGFPYDRRRHADFYLSYFKAFMLRTQGMRRAGSAALDLCFVAAGRVDGFWEWSLHAWDVAAGALIVEEAGGRVTDFHGNDLDPFAGQILATNGRIHEPMREVIAGISATHPDRR
ncbi:MAG: inositol monophosphatase family protein [Candidatus Binatia bacterium]